MATSWRWAIAYRYARSGARHRLVSFMALISVGGLVLGVAVLVLVLSVMNGFEQELRERVLGVLPHGVIYRDGGFPDWQETAAHLLEHPEVLGVAPFAEGNGLAVANEKVEGVGFVGIDPVYERDVSIVAGFLKAGSFDTLTSGDFSTVIGQELAETLGVSLGDRFTIVLPDARMTLAGPMPRTRQLKVVGIFEVGSDIDRGQIFLHLADANRLRRIARVDGLRIKVDDLFEAPRILGETAGVLDLDDVYAGSWMRRYGSLYDAIQVQKTTMFLLLLILVAVAAFNVVANLVMVVDDKRPDIAILRTLGASPASIGIVFVMHGLLLGVVGVAAGLLGGVAIAVNVNDLYQWLDSIFGLGLMDEYFVHYLPSVVLADDLIRVTAVSMLICLVATIYPARRAALARPVEALAYEA